MMTRNDAVGSTTHLMYETVNLVKGVQLESPLLGELTLDVLHHLGHLVPLNQVVPSSSLLLLCKNRVINHVDVDATREFSVQSVGHVEMCLNPHIICRKSGTDTNSQHGHLLYPDLHDPGQPLHQLEAMSFGNNGSDDRLLTKTIEACVTIADTDHTHLPLLAIGARAQQPVYTSIHTNFFAYLLVTEVVCAFLQVPESRKRKPTIRLMSTIIM